MFILRRYRIYLPFPFSINQAHWLAPEDSGDGEDTQETSEGR